MNEPVLDPRVRASATSTTISPSFRSSPETAEVFSTLEAKLARRIDEALARKLEEVPIALVAGQGVPGIDGIESLIDAKIKKAIAGSVSMGNDRTKEALLHVIQAVLLESGLLEKFVGRAVDQKLESLPPGGVHQGLSDASRKEIQGMIQKEASALLGSEEMKTMIDEKFRAITLYLKSDVIPKAVQQALKGPKPTP